MNLFQNSIRDRTGSCQTGMKKGVMIRVYSCWLSEQIRNEDMFLRFYRGMENELITYYETAKRFHRICDQVIFSYLDVNQKISIFE